MASFFISHSSRDGSLAEQVRDRLRGEGYEALFLDFDPEDGIPAGRDWELELYAQLRSSDAVVFLGSAASVDSKWCFAELALARLTGKPVFPVALEPGARHPLLADVQSIEWVQPGCDGEGFERLWSGFRAHGFDPRDSFSWDPSRSPFPGLSPLDADDAAVFFGRGDKVEELLSRLQPILASSGRFVALIGPSGSGKSSLLRAGVVPRLGRLGDRWVVVPPLRPGRKPFSTLARALASMLGGVDWLTIRSRLERDPAGLIEEAAGDAASAVLVVDQAEELVTAEADERAAFLGALGASLEDNSQFWVVASLRSESVTSILQETALANVVGSPVLLGPLDRSRIPEVIEGPAQRAGLEFEPGLVGRMVEETRGGDALPLLAYTLRQLYDRVGPDRRITVEDYEAIGGVLGALRGRADQINAELERAGKGDLVIPTLVKFASVEQNEPIGRRVPRANLSEDEDEVVQAFVEARLLTSDGAGGEAVAGVAHDSLLRSWAPLRQAIDASRDILRLRSELEHLAREWVAVGRSDSYLLREERLSDAENFLESEIGRRELMPIVSEFIDRSAARSQAVLRRESDLLAGRVFESLDEDPERGLLLALAAVEEYLPSPRAIRALNAAVTASKVRLSLVGHEAQVIAAAFSGDGSRVITASWDGTARLWDALTGEQLHLFPGREHWSQSAAFSPDGRRVVIARDDNTARVWDAISGEEQHALSGHEELVHSVAYSGDGSRLVTASEDGTSRVWDAASGEQLVALRGHDSVVWSAAFSADATHIVTASHDRTARVWTATGGEELHVLQGHEEAVKSAVFSLDGSSVVTASDDKTARIWDAVGGTGLHVLQHEGRLFSAVFSSDGNKIVTGSDDGTARIWDAQSGEELHVLRHDGGVASAVFAADGSRVVTSSGDGTARLWNAVTGGELQDFRGHALMVVSADFSPDESRVITASWDSTARVWDAVVGDELHVLRHERAVLGAAFSTDGNRVVTASQDETARVWDAASGEQLSTLRHEASVTDATFSPDDCRLLTVSDEVRVWDAVEGNQLLTLHGHEFGTDTTSAVFSPDGSLIVTASFFRRARVWDAASGEEMHVLPHDESVNRAGFSQDGSLVVTASDKAARVWDVASGRELCVLRHDDLVSGAVFSADGSRIVTASKDKTARIWDPVSGEELHVLRHDGGVASAVFAVDGSRVVSASADRTARVWDAISGQELHALDHAHDVVSAVFSRDGSRIVTASQDMTARVWDAKAGEELQRLRGHEDGVWSAAFSPDGSRVVTRSYDGTARIWEILPLDLLVAKAKSQVTRELTAAERAEYGLTPTQAA
jgi:WD40 repeat protein